MKSKTMLLACLVIMLMGCKSKKEEKVSETTYNVTTPLLTKTSVTKDYVANIQSIKNIEIRAQVEGILQQIYVDEGQMVRKGQPLFKIAIVGADEEIAKNKAATEQAQIDLRNTALLTKNGIVSDDARKMAHAKLKAAVADYKLSVLHKRLSVIYAPFSGIIGKIPEKKGSLIEQDDQLTTLSDNSSMHVYFNVSEPEYLDYQMHASERKKEPLSLILANGAVFPAKGYVQNIEGEFDSQTGTIPFRATFANAKNLLRNGQTGTIRWSIPKHNALVIPQQATYEVQDRRYVFVVDGNGVVHSRQIYIADEQSGVYVVEKGLKPSDRFLVDGVQKVNDGDKVKTRYASPSTIMRSLKLQAN